MVVHVGDHVTAVGDTGGDDEAVYVANDLHWEQKIPNTGILAARQGKRE